MTWYNSIRLHLFTSYLDTLPPALTSPRPATPPWTPYSEQKLVDGNAPINVLYGWVHGWKTHGRPWRGYSLFVNTFNNPPWTFQVPTAPTYRRPAPPTVLKIMDEFKFLWLIMNENPTAMRSMTWRCIVGYYPTWTGIGSHQRCIGRKSVDETTINALILGRGCKWDSWRTWPQH